MTVSDKHVSRRLRASALASIDAKRSILMHWLRNGLPPSGPDASELDWYPTSLRTFCAWDGSQNSASVRRQIKGVTRNSYETLAAGAERLNDVRRLLKLVKVEAEATKRRLDPKVALHESAVELEAERAKRRGALLGYRRARQETRAWRRKFQDEERAHRETMLHLKKELKDRDAELVELHAQVATLTAMLKKTSPIRSVR